MVKKDKYANLVNKMGYTTYYVNKMKSLTSYYKKKQYLHKLVKQYVNDRNNLHTLKQLGGVGGQERKKIAKAKQLKAKHKKVKKVKGKVKGKVMAMAEALNKGFEDERINKLKKKNNVLKKLNKQVKKKMKKNANKMKRLNDTIITIFKIDISILRLYSF